MSLHFASPWAKALAGLSRWSGMRPAPLVMEHHTTLSVGVAGHWRRDACRTWAPARDAHRPDRDSSDLPTDRGAPQRMQRFAGATDTAIEALSQLWLMRVADSRNPENIPVEGGLAPLACSEPLPSILEVVVEVRAPADPLDVPDNRDAPAHPAAGLILGSHLGLVPIQMELVRHLDPPLMPTPRDDNPTPPSARAPARAGVVREPVTPERRRRHADRDRTPGSHDTPDRPSVAPARLPP
jgi:hypothetical protein